MTEEQIKSLEEVIELLERIIKNGGMRISGLERKDYEDLKLSIEEIIGEDY